MTKDNDEVAATVMVQMEGENDFGTAKAGSAGGVGGRNDGGLSAPPLAPPLVQGDRSPWTLQDPSSAGRLNAALGQGTSERGSGAPMPAAPDGASASPAAVALQASPPPGTSRSAALAAASTQQGSYRQRGMIPAALPGPGDGGPTVTPGVVIMISCEEAASESSTSGVAPATDATAATAATPIRSPPPAESAEPRTPGFGARMPPSRIPRSPGLSPPPPIILPLGEGSQAESIGGGAAVGPGRTMSPLLSGSKVTSPAAAAAASGLIGLISPKKQWLPAGVKGCGFGLEVSGSPQGTVGTNQSIK